MPEAAHGGRKRIEEPGHFHREHMAEDVQRFARWFVKTKFALMQDYLPELGKSPIMRKPAELEERFMGAIRHAKRVLLLRGVVSVLLAIGAVTAFTSTVLNFTQILPAPLAAAAGTTARLLEGIAAISASATLLLIVVRLGIDRYLELLDVTATYAAMQLASSR